MKITLVAGARPNFMKIAPIIRQLDLKKAQGIQIEYRLVHTGQHYDKNLSDTFFDQLGIPEPHVNLEVKSGSQAAQTSTIMVRFEEDLIKNPTDLIIVVGDVNSTMACAIVAKKAGIKLAHVEAGIRSGDLFMPEEINRIVTDSITDYLFTTSELACENLLESGKQKEQIYYVGNVMIDTLLHNVDKIKQPSFWEELNLQSKNYFVITLHRPSNVDEAQIFGKLLEQIVENSNGKQIVFPVHPRTLKIINSENIQYDNLHFVDPMGYLEFIYLVKHAAVILTDSGGITEEATILNVPCITFRDSTERPETCDLGTNVLVGNDVSKIQKAFSILHKGEWKNANPIPKWDGKAAERIVDHILTLNRD